MPNIDVNQESQYIQGLLQTSTMKSFMAAQEAK